MSRMISRGLLCGLLAFTLSCDTLNQIATTAAEQYANANPTQGEMIQGLKEALANGAKFATGSLGAEGGYFNDPIVRIPFPEEAEVVATKMRQIGLGSLVDDFERKLNEGAEEGAKLALPIFKEAITGMTLNDAKGILLGGDNAATEYFKGKTSAQLQTTYGGVIQQSLDEVGAAKAWTEITTRYNKIPFVKQVNTDLVSYTTGKALDGLFLKVAEEEAKIRQEPIARTSELLKKVFEYADREKQ
ncbi:DUF4197 domain-containing protein [Pontibacter sp. G13]|uniref:DUF4197 domain-containing protein n=1 Tax=Pontibacter sp. G13 TaxID=3074898 RepID=UPI00288A6F00|nr:DUF4197 domain-containing protein [Pontibacter sp. G13]WNJ17274.1 DUF4197 domain-containing protein [Pontibacter sp. G13]